MRIYPPELEISDTEGFAPEKDIFGRAKLGEGLANLLGQLRDPTVLAVDGPWGSGKSAFLRMWAGLLRSRNFPVVYFDAFENDYADDAFTTIASQIIDVVDRHKKLTTPAGRKFVKSATATGKILLRSGLRLGVKIATLNALDTKELEDAAEAASEELSGLTDKLVGERLTQHKENVETFEAFRTALSELPAVLGHSDANTPMIVIIDELDRCRPIYALELLEKIKHFFRVPNVHFVLGVNLDQLENSVTTAYGSKIDAKSYLQKFIQIVCPLVDTSEHAHERVAQKYISYLKKALEFDPKDGETVRYASESLVDIAEKKGLSLRDIERAMSNVALVCAFTTPNTLRPAPIVAGLAVIKALDPSMYRRAKEGRLEYPEVKAFLGLSETPDPNEAPFDEKWWRLCTDRSVSKEFVDRMYHGLGRFNLWSGHDRLLPLIANQVMDRLEKSA